MEAAEVQIKIHRKVAFFWLRNLNLSSVFPGGAHQTAGLAFYNVKGVVSYAI